ncbi:2'-5' RNA ligase family protein [Paludisphaera soli]|uniref:2'-5' RNA ligase family protein n=1 Tax=Paludisphaera soli TaxID=2712865 RepID=UPI0013EC6ABF|nr:2'-5' RNA ligase family protein [Paludisphaera soli]
MLEPPTFIATVKLDDESSRRLDRLRKRYFPPERNFLDAHVTLFHKLFAEGLTILEAEAAEADPRPFEVALSGPFSLGRGVAIRVESGELVALRRRLAARLVADLSAQDRQPYNPHVTIQNKVTAEEARETLAAVRREWIPSVARVEGIDVWEYLGGPWEHHARLPFRA